MTGAPRRRAATRLSHGPAGRETRLLAEYEDEVRELAGGVLERQGFRVLAARDQRAKW